LPFLFFCLSLQTSRKKKKTPLLLSLTLPLPSSSSPPSPPFQPSSSLPADFNVVTVDDTLCSLHWCEPVEEAVQEHQRRGTIRRVYGVSEGKVTREVEAEGDDGEAVVEEKTYYTRGMTVARYQF
jgi:hypothetical protein